MIEVYGRPDSSNSAKIFWLLDIIGVEYTLILTGRGYAPVDTEGFLALNPFGKVPVIRDGNFVLSESNAILRYLARRYEAKQLWPDNIQQQSAIDSWMDWVSTALVPPLTAVRKQSASSATSELPKLLLSAFQILEQRLTMTPFIGGESFSLADIVAGAAVHRWFLLDGKRPDMPALEKYAFRLAEQQGYREHIQNPLS